MAINDIKLICFDLDKTLIQQNTWYKLNLALGMSEEEDQDMLTQYNQGTLPYHEWINRCLKIYTRSGKASRKNIETILSDYTISPETKEVIDYLKQKSFRIALVSGSMDIMVKKIADELGIEFAQAVNMFVFDEQEQLVAIENVGDESVAKLHILENICKQLNIPINACAAVGDGDNDAELFRATRHGITFTGSPLAAMARKTIPSLVHLKSIFSLLNNLTL